MLRTNQIKSFVVLLNCRFHSQLYDPCSMQQPLLSDEKADFTVLKSAGLQMILNS